MNKATEVQSLKPANIFLMGAVAAIAGLLFGFDTGVISGAQEFMFNYFNMTEQSLYLSAIKGLVVASVPLGALFGAIVSGYFAQGLGRRRSLMFTAVLFLIGTFFAAFAPTIHFVIVGRVIMGLAIGISAMVAPMYLAEISPPDNRGSIIFFFQLAITIGIFVSFAIDLWFAKIFESSVAWRWMFGVGVVPSVLLFFGMIKLPPSPRWLILKNRFPEAQAVMQRLLGRLDVSEEMNEMKESYARKQSGDWRALFKKPLLPLLGVAFALFVFQQLSGINAVIYYGPSIFEKAGFGAESKFMAQLFIGLINVVATILGVWVVDKLGRRPLLFIGFVGMIICLGLMGFCLKAYGLHPYLSLAAALAYIVFFAISLGGVPYILMSELFPLKVRASGMAIASCANWGFNMLVSFSFGILVELFGGMGNVFMLYMAFTIVGLIFAHKYVPETKRRHLEEIEDNFYHGKELSHLGDEQGVTADSEEMPAGAKGKYEY